MGAHIRVDEVAYHRNGVSGEPFYAVAFREREGRRWRRFVASVFTEPGYVSVLSLDLLPEHGVSSMHNGWRGDYYEADLRAAIAEHVKRSRAELDKELGITPAPVKARTRRVVG